MRRQINIMYYMDLDEPQPKGLFECELCRLSVPYTYYGQRPPNSQSVVLLEECFVTKDPFTPEKEKFLILGSPCSLCKKSVCVGTECSLFYSKRFCLPCVTQHREGFPPEIQQDLDKRKAQKKS
uniref:Cysteine-rich DPF motif domain-containing protein 1 n=1 Tax=Xenopus tropicalis TaxID=8364 RepID=A0A803JIZ5_XENTR|eukprot:XP_012813609.1 PREDICTED: cysteine-rich DPF motif domain-containing protein 1 isoform X3 [Xenopus tropicalis]